MSLYSRYGHDPKTRTRMRSAGGTLALAACILACVGMGAQRTAAPGFTARYTPPLLAVAGSLSAAASYAANPRSVHQGYHAAKTWRDFPSVDFTTAFRFEKARRDSGATAAATGWRVCRQRGRRRRSAAGCGG